MKIEMGESLLYSWLRHVKKGQIVQTNLTTFGQWTLLYEEKQQEIKAVIEQHFQDKYGYVLYKRRVPCPSFFNRRNGVVTKYA